MRGRYVQGGQVELTTAGGATWQGSISGSLNGSLTAQLVKAGGGGGAIALTIQVPTLTLDGHEFASQVSARTES